MKTLTNVFLRDDTEIEWHAEPEDGDVTLTLETPLTVDRQRETTTVVICMTEAIAARFLRSLPSDAPNGPHIPREQQ